MSAPKCGGAAGGGASKPKVPETLCFKAPEGSCGAAKESKDCGCDENANKKEEKKEDASCRQMPKVECDQACEEPKPKQEEKPFENVCCGRPRASIPKVECGFDRCEQIREPKPEDCSSNPSSSSQAAPEKTCGCSGKGISCGPNTSCEVMPLRMKRK